MQKPAPVYSLELVFHPQRDAAYKHFEQAAQNPFEPDPTGFPLVNAWWLADSALLTYWDEAEAKPIFQSAGLESRFLRRGSTDCYLAWSSRFVIVAFRGTEPDEWQDTLTDLKIKLVPWPSGKVHKGFKQALDEIWKDDLEPAIRALAGGRTVWFCGHSLGAALATLAADRYPGTRGVATFGCPRLGDKAFAAAFNARFAGASLRYVNRHDLVTKVPLSPSYRHVEEARYIAADGTISGDGPSVLGALEGLPKPGELREMIGSLKGGTPAKVPSALLDHMPKAYAIWTWNDYDAHS